MSKHPDPAADPFAGLDEWIAGQREASAVRMFAAISATGIVKHRTGFGQVMRPHHGSVLASPELSSYDPDPDYFFHWLRDAAVVMESVRLLAADPVHGPAARQAFADYIRFSHHLCGLSGSARLAEGDPREGVQEFFLQYVRPQADIARAEGDFVRGETRYNPDGTIDIISWPRPQFDGPAMRALGILRVGLDALPEDVRPLARDLVIGDCDCIVRRWREPSFDIWEEEIGLHFYTRLGELAALEAAAHAGLGDVAAYRREADALREALAAHWSAEAGFYLSRLPGPGTSRDKALDIATCLAAVHVGGAGIFSVADPRMQETLMRLEALFADSYALNRERPAGVGVLVGRYADDHYYAGGPYTMVSLTIAEFYFQLSALLARREIEADALSPAMAKAFAEADEGGGAAAGALRRGDAILAAVRRFTPPSGELSEQIDQTSGELASAKNLTWSYAAFIAAEAARREALRLLSA